MDKLATFNQHRPLLFAIAYRMLSSATEAEDVLQEAWIRWQSTSTPVKTPKPYLSQIVTRLCIDYLRSARFRRERYVGTWLPEPLAVSSIKNPEEHAALAESLSFAFLKLLECLSPTERAVFLLREVFDYSYEDIAKIVDKSTSNCRQVVHRAKQHLRSHKPRIETSPQQKAKAVERFLECWQQGNLSGLLETMTEETVFISDGGGKVTAALYPLEGSQKVARFLLALRRSRLMPLITSQFIDINGQPGIINSVEGKPQSIFSFEFKGGRIQTIFAVANPDKLDSMHSQSTQIFGVS